MKILFMGTPDFALPCLEAIYKSGNEIVSVITQPDRPKGRGKKVMPPPVKIKAEKLGLNIMQPLNIKDRAFIDNLKKMDIDCIVVVAYGQILPKEILDMPAKGCINVHASLLPKYRGAAPINWVIINGEKKTGITTMYMNEGLDTGDMILKEEVEIDENMTAGELHDKLASLGAKVLIKTLNLIEKDKAPRIPQNDSESSYASMLDKKIGLIDWEKTAYQIHNLIRGLNPWPVAYTRYKGIKFKVWKSRVINQNSNEVCGKILKVDKEGIYVSTKEDLLLIEEIQFPNSRKMTVDEYIRGNKIETNVILGE
ncbi:methionyl-tRNA formyltransferase [Caminicella sporogenes]|uniref:methionyl-tRNA formyltransferase n=1 Tax=Caminicella sporogenes TaxID=166485 RepID=UPI0025419A52|nr:methionyl-tRNA formyltransferase [Caminicella sporogenes]WIF94583.1 methionyl-tRNA formyltransferase [Caminicella sporogenes]